MNKLIVMDTKTAFWTRAILVSFYKTQGKDMTQQEQIDTITAIDAFNEALKK